MHSSACRLRELSMTGLLEDWDRLMQLSELELGELRRRWPAGTTFYANRLLAGC